MEPHNQSLCLEALRDTQVEIEASALKLERKPVTNHLQSAGMQNRSNAGALNLQEEILDSSYPGSLQGVRVAKPTRHSNSELKIVESMLQSAPMASNDYCPITTCSQDDEPEAQINQRIERVGSILNERFDKFGQECNGKWNDLEQQ